MLQIDDRRFSRLALFGVIIGFGLLLTALVAVIMAFALNQRSNALVTHTYQVADQLAQLEIYVERSETSSRGYLLVPDPARTQTFRDNSSKIPAATVRLARLTADNPRQRENLKRLMPILNTEIQTLKGVIRLAGSGKLDEARRIFAAEVAKKRVNAIRALSTAMRAEEERLLESRSKTVRNFTTILFIILSITAVLLLLFAVAVIVIVRRYTETLLTARNRLNVLNNDLEGAVQERTADLQRAKDEIQRFAYIVSHDLRSPLVNILGFTAELEETNKSLVALLDRAQKEAPQILTTDSLAARQDLPEAIGFIRSSTQKMDRLINAILKLSREGRRTLSPERLKMTDVVKGIVDSLEHRITETGTTVTVDKALPDIVSDRVAIEQIFSNLIENAIKYLQPGRPGQIAVRGFAKGDRLIFEVEDNGRGIDVKDHERVFDLFRRSGMQDQPGEGIGLAHVRALAYRLGGFIDLKSELGHGATFQVNLPATYADQGVRN